MSQVRLEGGARRGFEWGLSVRQASPSMLDWSRDKWILWFDVLLGCEQGNIYEGIWGNWLAGLKSWRWEVKCLYSKGGVGILQFSASLKFCCLCTSGKTAIE